MMIGAISLIMLLAMLLIAPIKYCIVGQRQERSYGEIKVSWLWGVEVCYSYDSQAGFNNYIKLLCKKISFHGRKNKAAAAKKKNFDFKYLLDKAFLKKAIKFFKDMVDHIKPQTFVLNGKIGLDNPFNTAMAIGMLSLLDMPGVTIEPIFDEEILEGKLEIRGEVVIGIVLMMFIKFLITQPVRNIVIKLIKNKGEKSYVH